MALSLDKEKFHEQFSTNVRVLIIDHDINFLNDIEKKCTQYHYSVKTCSTISEASDILIEKKDCFDVILIEAKMLDLDSYDFVQFVTQQMNIPAIMMCVDDTTSVVNKAIDKGACDFWIKPFSENNIKIMWQHVARKIWNEAKKDENLKVKGKKARENDKNEAKKEEKNEAKKERVVWTPELHKIFVTAVKELNLNNAVPLKILEKMNVPGLSRENVASHLQKFRQYLKTKKEQTGSANVAGYNYNSQEFDFQAYYDATRHLEVPRQIQNQMPYGYNSSQQVTNNLMSRMLPNNAADAFGSGMFMMNNNHTFPMHQEHHVHQMSPNFVNQPNYGGFGSNSVINSSFNNTIDAAYFQNTPGGSFFLGGNSHQIPMTQPLLMSSSMIGATPSASGPSPFSAANVGDMNAATLSLSGPSLFSAASVGDMNAAMTSLSGPSLFSAANVGDMNAAMTSLSGPSPFSAANVGDMNAATTSSSGLSPFSAANVGDMNAANTILTEEDIAQLNFLL